MPTNIVPSNKALSRLRAVGSSPYDRQPLFARDRVEKLGRWFSSPRGLVATHAHDIADGDTYGIRKCGGIVSNALGSHAHAFDKIGGRRLAAHRACRDDSQSQSRVVEGEANHVNSLPGLTKSVPVPPGRGRE